MNQSILNWSRGLPSGKVLSKETLNNRDIIEKASNLSVHNNTRKAYLRAYEALGIDIINRVPVDNAPIPSSWGEFRTHPELPYYYTSLGVYDTAIRYKFPCTSTEDVWELDMNTIHYSDLITPVPHFCEWNDIHIRQQLLQNVGLYYPMLYTTLFMWAVEVLGWEVFMLAGIEQSGRFHEHFLVPCVEKSKQIIHEILEASESPFIFVHDDLADASGPVFPPSWYDEFIFPHYPEIWKEAKDRGKKIILVADGNMTEFLPNLLQAGVDGFMFENPATSIDDVISYFGLPGKIMIGGIDTQKLTYGTPEEVKQMVYDLHGKTKYIKGFAISSCGGLHGNIPLPNLEAYFDARADIGATPEDWRTRYGS